MTMKQSWWASFGETAVNTFAGFGLSLALQWLYFDYWLGFPLHILDNLVFALIMTVVSLARGLTVRRVFEAIGLRVKLSAAMQAVIAERWRQVKEKGYDAAHDEKYTPRELAVAGAAYLTAGGLGGDRAPKCWPWTDEHWNPTKDLRGNLVRGCALGLAALDRLESLRRHHSAFVRRQRAKLVRKGRARKGKAARS